MRYGIDPATLLLIADHGLAVDPAHSLVAPNRILGDLLTILLGEVRRGARRGTFRATTTGAICAMPSTWR